MMSQHDLNAWIRIGVFLICLCCALISHLVYRKRVRNNEKNPTTQVRATVVERRVQIIRSHSRSLYANDRHIYYLTFKPDDGEKVEFQVSRVEYDAYYSGRRGVLTYRTWEYLGFCPLREEETPRDVPVAFADEDEG